MNLKITNFQEVNPNETSNNSEKFRSTHQIKCEWLSSSSKSPLKPNIHFAYK